MVRPQKTVCSEDEAFLLRYWTRALSDPSKSDLIQAGSRLAALAELNDIQNSGHIDPLQNWINRWLTDKGKNRVWAALRQQRYKERHKLRMVSLDEDAYGLLATLAKRNSMTFSETIKSLFKDVKKDRS